jgi:hypothetical protein
MYTNEMDQSSINLGNSSIEIVYQIGYFYLLIESDDGNIQPYVSNSY